MTRIVSVSQVTVSRVAVNSVTRLCCNFSVAFDVEVVVEVGFGVGVM